MDLRMTSIMGNRGEGYVKLVDKITNRCIIRTYDGYYCLVAIEPAIEVSTGQHVCARFDEAGAQKILIYDNRGKLYCVDAVLVMVNIKIANKVKQHLSDSL